MHKQLNPAPSGSGRLLSPITINLQQSNHHVYLVVILVMISCDIKI